MTDFTFPPAPATRQEAFDRAALHLLRTRKPSFTVGESGFATCQYGGSGCALRPFLPDDPQALRYFDGLGAIADIPLEDLPDWMIEEIEFFSDLQQAHDDPLNGRQNVPDPAKWFASWAAAMQKIATRYRLDDSLITDALALEAQL